MPNKTPAIRNEFDNAAEGRGVLLEAYELLRLRPLRWQAAWHAIVSPVERLHAYRNTRTRYLRHALCELDCGPPPAAADCHGPASH